MELRKELETVWKNTGDDYKLAEYVYQLQCEVQVAHQPKCTVILAEAIRAVRVAAEEKIAELEKRVSYAEYPGADKDHF